jgi:hypothetical protein
VTADTRADAGAEDSINRSCRAPLGPELEGELAVQDVERLVEVVVMKRRPGPTRGDGDSDHRDLVVALLASQKNLKSRGLV